MVRVVCKSSPENVLQFLRSIPDIMVGRQEDAFNLRHGMKMRVAWTFFSLVVPDFVEKGRGGTGADGDRWPDLSDNYKAYGKRFKGVGFSVAGLSPSGRPKGGKKGLNQKDASRFELIRNRNLARLAGKFPVGEARSRADNIAWQDWRNQTNNTKIAAGKALIVGTHYQILKDEGTLLLSIQPAEIVEGGGPGAEYTPNTEDQIVEEELNGLILGSRLVYANAHHEGSKNLPQRRLWPDEIPDDWMRQILDAVTSGIVRIAELARDGRL